MSNATPELLDPAAEQEPIAETGGDRSAWEVQIRAMADEAATQVRTNIAQYAAETSDQLGNRRCSDAQLPAPEGIVDEFADRETALCVAIRQIHSGNREHIARLARTWGVEFSPGDAIVGAYARSPSHLATQYAEGLQELRTQRRKRAEERAAAIVQRPRVAPAGREPTAAEEEGLPNAGA